ncbi:AMP-binding protein [Roseibium sp.]|uniref:AMP-binding protein n=1 Tax=Roseibium sp. TaxID=1936156 RepID=UPI003264BE8C
MSGLVSLQATRRADSPAVSTHDETISYGMLEARACALADWLCRHGGTAPVGILDDRGPDRIAAMLGCMKAGRAYVPLDPSLPAKRLLVIARHAGLETVVAPACSSSLLPGMLQPLRLGIEDLPAAPDRISLDSRPDTPLYLLYTSGSTGAPKGVAMSEGPLRNLAGWHRTALPLTPGDRVLQYAPLGFDVATQEILTTLCGGGELVLTNEPVRRDPKQLLELVSRRGVSRMFLPVHALGLIAAAGLARPQVLRDVITAGEALVVTPAIEAFFAGGHCRLHNHYGPTETHVVSALTLKGDSACWPRRVPIGQPISNVEISLRDKGLAPVGPGEDGEICIAGAALSDGYHHEPDLTAACFPNSPRSGKRLFRTGDIARLGPDGYEFLGRRDRQTKLRGIRIDLDAVETALGLSHAVEVAAVVQQEVGGGLRAFVVPAQEARDRVAEDLRRTWLDRARTLWDSVYSELPESTDSRTDTRGWRDSTRHHSYSRSELGDWADATASRIRALGARRLLEVGCGSGMLLTRLLDHCTFYAGTDISPQALEEVKTACRKLGLDTSRLSLACQPAQTPFAECDRPFDCVLLNSVVELFPDRAYFQSVLETAIAQTGKGGLVFLGDLRNLTLLELFHTRLECARAAPSDLAVEVSRRVTQQAGSEQRLFVDPDYFRQLARLFPRVAGVELALRRDRQHTEMCLYRYDAVLHLDHVAGLDRPVRTYDWPDCPPLSALRSYCDAGSVVCVTGIPNRRLSEDVALQAQMNAAAPQVTMKTIRERAAPDPGAQDPEDLFALSGDGYECRVSFAAGCKSGSLALWMSKGSPPVEPADGFLRNPTVLNDPLGRDIERILSRRIRQDLRGDLPDVMVPSEIRIVSALPLTRSGKIDRSRLSVQPVSRTFIPAPELAAPPSGPAAVILRCWREILGTSEIDIDLTFFDHGGSSLQLVELFLMLKEQLSGPFELVDLMRCPTVRGLTQHLCETGGSDTRAKADEIHA